MNPFAWPGPQFLDAYLVMAVALIAAGYWLWYRSGRGARAPKVTDLTGDPYRIACLRAGTDEVVRLAIFNLLDRGILELDYEKGLLRAARPDMLESLRRPLDRTLLKVCKAPVEMDRLLGNTALQKGAEDYQRGLGAAGLVSEGRDWAVRATYAWAAAGLLAGVAIAKIAYAMAHGMRNVLYLFVAACAASLWLGYLARRRRTFAGGRMLRHLQALMDRLKLAAQRVALGGSTNEALLLASTFGLYALPLDRFPFVEALFPRPGPSIEASFDSGDSCSSGCGGGGGCGGCGS